MEGNAELLEAALTYARFGYPVLPLHPTEKTPACSHGLLDATTDEEQIINWWKDIPEANVAIRTDGLIIIDIDGRNNMWLSEDEPKLESLSTAPRQITGNGGNQIFFRQPSGKSWRNTASKIAELVDTRGNGGYVCVPPSRLDSDPETGRKYKWVDQRNSCLCVTPEMLPEPPVWLAEILDAIAERRYQSPTKSKDNGNAIPDGRRNSTLTSMAGSLRRIGLDEGAIYSALQSTNATRCRPILPEEEVKKIAKSVSRYEPDQVATALAEGGIFLDSDEDDSPKDPGLFPEDLLNVPGLVGDIIQHNLNTALFPQPILALGGALALMSTITGHKVCSERLQTNIYVMGLCDSGGGKEHARKLNKQCLHLAGLENLIGPESIGSSAGLVSSISEERVRLFQLDEIARLLHTIGSPTTAPHLYNIISVLLKLYSSAGDIYVGEAYADIKKVKRIHWPHAVLYGTAPPESFYSNLSKEDLQDGFVSRLLIFETDNHRPKATTNSAADPPQVILDQIRYWHEHRPTKGNIANLYPEPRSLQWDQDSTAILAGLSEMATEEESKLRKKKNPLAAMWLRVVENAKKLAMLHACSSQGTGVEVVKGESTAWAFELVEFLTRRMLNRGCESVSDGPVEKRIKQILKSIRESGPDGLSHSGIIRRFQALQKRQREEIIETLMESGQILRVVMLPGPQGGRKGARYFTPDNYDHTRWGQM